MGTGDRGAESAVGPPVSRTARYVALSRALESARPAPSRLFEDSLARGFLDPRLRLVASAAGLSLLRRFFRGTSIALAIHSAHARRHGDTPSDHRSPR